MLSRSRMFAHNLVAWIRLYSFEYKYPFLILSCFLIFLSVASLSSGDDFHGIRATNNTPPKNVALVILSHDREEYFELCLKSVLKTSALENIDIIVSIDNEPSYESLAKIATDLHPDVTFMYNADAPADVTGSHKIGYHHKRVFQRAFSDMNYDYVIVLESDLTVSQDFLEYFLALRHLLVDPRKSSAKGSNLWCISAWNDNGMKYFSLDQDKVMRTDFFPGLGWMIHRSTWTNILQPIWRDKTGNYDWWLRELQQLNGKDCLFPQVPRTHHISKYGTHVNGKDYEWYEQMATSSQTSFSLLEKDIQLLQSPAEYEAALRREKIQPGRLASFDPFMKIPQSDSLVFVVSGDESEANSYEKMAKFFRLFSNFRSSYRGMLTFTLGQEFGFTNITLVQEHSREFWNIPLP